MKFSNDFMRIAKAIVLYFVIAILGFPLFHLIKGDFTWGDTFINAALNLVAAIILGVIYYFGSHVPKN